MPIFQPQSASSTASSGVINYLESNPNAEGNQTTGWSTYADAAGSSPVDGTGGSPNITWTATNTNPLRGSYSFIRTKDAANRQGEGISFDFTIEKADKGKVLQISFDYSIVSGTYGDDATTVWIYDVTNATLIQPSPYTLKNHSLDAERWFGEFQTSSSSTSYRLIIHISSTVAVANVLKFDNFFVGPSAKLYGSPITDWVSYTPTGSWVSNTTYTGYWRRVGDSLEATVKIATSGAPTAAALTVNLPTGLTVDTAKLTNTSSNYDFLGGGTANDSGGVYKLFAAYSSTTAIAIEYQSNASGAASSVTQAAPFTFGASDFVIINFKVPILGWSSSAIMSSDADTRVVAATIHAAANLTGVNPNASAVKILFDTASYDTNNAWASNKYTIQVPGKYRISANIMLSGTNVLANQYQGLIYKNGSQAGSIQTITPVVSTACSLSGSRTFDLIAGDYIEIYLYGAGNNSVSTLTVTGAAANSYVSIEKLSGPSQIAASEKIIARYSTNAGSSIANSTVTYLDFEDKTFDTHGIVSGTGSGVVTTTNTGWKCTSPVSGYYRISAKVLFSISNAWVDNEDAYLAIYKNGSVYSVLDYNPYGGTTTIYKGLGGSDVIQLIASDRIEIVIWQNSGGALTLHNDGSLNYVTIEKVNT